MFSKLTVLHEMRPRSPMEPLKYMTHAFAPEAPEDRRVFEDRFYRSYRLLRHMASRILAEPETIDAAIENCWRTASRHQPRSEYEGEFRSWLLRLLIDEADPLLPPAGLKPRPLA